MSVENTRVDVNLEEIRADLELGIEDCDITRMRREWCPALISEIERLRKELQAHQYLRETLVRAHSALTRYVEWCGSVHEQDCSMDDTCSCAGKATNDRVNASIREIEGLLGKK